MSKVTIQITKSTPHFAGTPLDEAVQGIPISAVESEWENGVLVEGSAKCYVVEQSDLWEALVAAGQRGQLSISNLPIQMVFRPSHCKLI